MKLVDLTGAKVTWKNNFTSLAPFSYNVDFEISGYTNTFDGKKIYCELHENTSYYALKYQVINQSNSSTQNLGFYYEVSGILDNSYDVITVTGGEDATNPDLIAFVLEHSDIEGGVWEEEGTTITYNETTTTLTEGQTATIKCEGEKAKSDIVISGKCNIVYNYVVTEVLDGQVATMKCNGKKMMSDVEVEVVKAQEIPTDLTGYTLYWDSKLVVSLDNIGTSYSTESINSMDYYFYNLNFSSNRLNDDDSLTSYTFIKIGNWLNWPSSFACRLASGSVIELSKLDDNNWFYNNEIKVTGGTDATNPDLINWLLSLGMKFKKTESDS